MNFKRNHLKSGGGEIPFLSRTRHEKDDFTVSDYGLRVDNCVLGLFAQEERPESKIHCEKDRGGRNMFPFGRIIMNEILM